MNYYEILGLKKEVSGEEIKTSFKKLIKKYHPDVYLGDKTFAEFKTKEINIAYDVLSNPTLKKEYDLSLNPKPEIIKEENPPKSYTDTYNYDFNSNYSYDNYKNKYHTENESNNSFYSSSINNAYRKYHDAFSNQISNRVAKLSFVSKLIFILILLLIYLLFFLINILELQKLSNSNYNNKNNNINTINSNLTQPSEKDYYIDEEELEKYYYNNLHNTSAFENYEDFRYYIEYYYSN